MIGLLVMSPAHADEGGASVYLLGSGGPGAAVLPPLEGIYFENDLYYYDGSASGEKQFVVGGSLVAGLDATILADFASLAWVPTTDLAGGTLVVGGALPVGAPSVEVNAVITGPGGGTASPPPQRPGDGGRRSAGDRLAWLEDQREDPRGGKHFGQCPDRPLP